MPVQLKLQLVSVAGGGSESTEDVLVLTKEHERLEQLALTLAEGKQLLREVQRRVVQRQATACLATQTVCPTCGRERGSKDHKTLSLGTLFGKLSLDSPRVRRCCRQAGQAASISPVEEVCLGAQHARAAVPGGALGFAGLLRADGPRAARLPASR